MNIVPLVASAPMTLSAAARVVGQVPDRTASFLTFLADAVGNHRPNPGSSNHGVPPPRGDLPIPAGRRTFGKALSNRISTAAADTKRLVRLVRAGMRRALRDAGIQTPVPVRLQVRTDGKMAVTGTTAAQEAIRQALAGDRSLANAIRQLQTVAGQGPFEITVGGPLADRNIS